MLTFFALGLTACVSLETMALDFSSQPVKDWLANKSGDTYPVSAVSKWTLKPERRNKKDRAALRILMTKASLASVVEQGSVYYTFSPDLWDRWSFWCQEQWATKTDFLTHVSPQGAFGKVWGNFSAVTTSQVAFYRNEPPAYPKSAHDLEHRMIALERRRPGFNPPAELELFDLEKKDKTYPVQMNLAFDDERLVRWGKSYSRMRGFSVDLVTRWTVKDTSSAGVAKWKKVMKNASIMSRKERGCLQYKWGQDVFDENSFWLLEQWENKMAQIAHVTTGAFGQQADMWFNLTNAMISLFNGDQIAPW